MPLIPLSPSVPAFSVLLSHILALVRWKIGIPASLHICSACTAARDAACVVHTAVMSFISIAVIIQRMDGAITVASHQITTLGILMELARFDRCYIVESKKRES